MYKKNIFNRKYFVWEHMSGLCLISSAGGNLTTFSLKLFYLKNDNNSGVWL